MIYIIPRGTNFALLGGLAEPHEWNKRIGLDDYEPVRQMLLECSDEGYAACCEALSTTNLLPELQAITAPVLVITADSDTSIPPETVVPLAGQIPGAHLEIIENAAHLVTYSHPQIINPLLLAHLG